MSLDASPPPRRARRSLLQRRESGRHHDLVLLEMEMVAAATRFFRERRRRPVAARADFAAHAPAFVERLVRPDVDELGERADIGIAARHDRPELKAMRKRGFPGLLDHRQLAAHVGVSAYLEEWSHLSGLDFRREVEGFQDVRLLARDEFRGL